MKVKSINIPEMSSDIIKIKELFNEYQTIVVPEHQRNYTWKEKQLLKIIKTSNDFNSNFIGTIILTKKSGIFYLQDGQQRITSLLGLVNNFNVKNNKKTANLKLHYENKDNIYYNYMRETVLCEKIDAETTKLKDPFRWIRLSVKKSEFNIDNILNLNLNIITIDKDIREEYNQHSIFLNLNNSGLPLTSYDLIKSMALRDYSNNTESGVLNKFNEIEDLTKNSGFTPNDAIYFDFLTNGYNISKAEMSRHYEKHFAIKVKEEVKGVKKDNSANKEEEMTIDGLLNSMSETSRVISKKVPAVEIGAQCDSFNLYFELLGNYIMTSISKKIRQSIIPMIWYMKYYKHKDYNDLKNNIFDTSNNNSKFKYVGSILNMVHLKDRIYIENKIVKKYNFQGNVFRKELVLKLKDSHGKPTKTLKNEILKVVNSHTNFKSTIAIETFINIFDELLSRNTGFFTRTVKYFSRNEVKMNLEHVFQFPEGKKVENISNKIWNICIIDFETNDKYGKIKGIEAKVKVKEYTSKIPDDTCLYTSILKQNNIKNSETDLEIMKAIFKTNVQFISQIFGLKYSEKELSNFDFKDFIKDKKEIGLE